MSTSVGVADAGNSDRTQSRAERRRHRRLERVQSFGREIIGHGIAVLSTRDADAGEWISATVTEFDDYSAAHTLRDGSGATFVMQLDASNAKCVDWGVKGRVGWVVCSCAPCIVHVLDRACFGHVALC